jgi:hypothetical protein
VSTADKESVEKTSKNSSPTRDSRSPVVFTQHTQPAEPEPPASPESDSASEDVDDEEEEESAGGDDTKPQNQDEESGYEDSGSEEDEVDDDEGAEVQVPKSSLPELLLSKTKTTAITATIPASSKQDSSQSKKMQHPATDSDEEGSTQDEVDQQLTSSLYTVPARAVSNTSVLAPRGSTTIPVPTSSAPRPQFRFGASLSSLNEKKPVFGAARKQGIVVKGAAPKKLELDEDEESEEEEEESDDESSESSDDEEDAKPIDSIVYSNPGPEPKPNDSTTSSGSSSITNSDSGEDDDSTSGKDSEAGIERAKNELAAEIECFAKESQGTTDEIPKPKRVRLKSPQEAKKMDPKAKRSDDRYLWGYQFQQPA